VRAIVIERNGGREVLEPKHVPDRSPRAERVLVTVEAVGANYRDVYERSGTEGGSRTHPIQDGDWVLVHAAAGGVGLLLTQIAKFRSGRVIGTTSSEGKAVLARAAGADEVMARPTRTSKRGGRPASCC
jgi:NADPH:quinone reductase-like Zn-dependent oxidoreductase